MIRSVPFQRRKSGVAALGGSGKCGDVYVRLPGGAGHFLQHICQRWVEALLPCVALASYGGEGFLAHKIILLPGNDKVTDLLGSECVTKCIR